MTYRIPQRSLVATKVRRRRSTEPTPAQSKKLVWTCRLGFVAALLVCWEYLPKISWFATHGFNPLFVSSPSQIARTEVDLARGTGIEPSVWPYLGSTLEAVMIGSISGVVIGATLALLLSNSDFIASVFYPLVVAANSIPRVTLIPVIVVMFGPSVVSDGISAFVIVVFLVVFAGFAGGRSIPQATVDNAKLLGARPRHVMLELRWPNVWSRTVEVLPNVISLAILASVTSELITGSDGIGQLLLTAITQIDSAAIFALALILSIIGVCLVALANYLTVKLRRWV